MSQGRRSDQPGYRAGLYTVRVLALLLCLLAPLSMAQADKWHFSGVERVVAIGDVHGAYDALVTTLQNADVIDDGLQWSSGKTHLVSTGDLLDRGADSRKVMDLMMRLEREAELAGGRVHQLLGNHEVMNLIGDLRYVADGEYLAYQDFESPEQRESWYRQFRLDQVPGVGEAAIRQEFDALAPPGFFGHRRALASDGLYGRWLLEKPFMIVINDIAFVHGGAPAYVTENGLAGVNGTLKDDLVGFLESAKALVDAGVLTPLDRSKQIPEKLKAIFETGQLQGRTAEIAQDLIEFGNSPLHGPLGPTWYRGTARCNRFVEAPRLTAALNSIGANRIVIGHTTAVTRSVQERMGGRVFEIDTGMLNHVYGGSGNALVFDNGDVSVLNQDRDRKVWPLEHPLQIGYDERTISEDDLATLFETGRVTAVAAEGAEWQLLQVSSGDLSVFASFRALPEGSRFAPEAAAYRLDRLLRLGMVPVTVSREIAGRKGTLQLLPGVTLTERERVAAGQGSAALCPVESQIDAMLVFDALVHNVARSPSSMVYDRKNWALMLVDHDDAFSADGSLPADLVNVGLTVGDEWRAALQALDDKVLRAELGDVLDKRRLRALGKRRDALISLGD